MGLFIFRVAFNSRQLGCSLTMLYEMLKLFTNHSFGGEREADGSGQLLH
jgi:hypothetical protein